MSTPPTLTGLGERAHLLAPAISLDTHIDDIANVLEYEDLRDVILVGHSYGGMIITGVAQRAPHRLAQFVYLDGWFPMDDDRSIAELSARIMPQLWSPLEEQIRTEGDGWREPAPKGENPLGLPNDEDARWVGKRLTDHPAATYVQRLPPDIAAIAAPRHLYVQCPKPGGGTPLAAFGARARREGWVYHELAGGHQVMMTMPRELVDLLVTLV